MASHPPLPADDAARIYLSSEGLDLSAPVEVTTSAGNMREKVRLFTGYKASIANPLPRILANLKAADVFKVSTNRSKDAAASEEWSNLLEDLMLFYAARFVWDGVPMPWTAAPATTGEDASFVDGPVPGGVGFVMNGQRRFLAPPAGAILRARDDGGLRVDAVWPDGRVQPILSVVKPGSALPAGAKVVDVQR